MVSHHHIELEVVDDAQKESPASNVRLPACVGVACMRMYIFFRYNFVNYMFNIRSYTLQLGYSIFTDRPSWRSHWHLPAKFRSAHIGVAFDQDFTRLPYLHLYRSRNYNVEVMYARLVCVDWYWKVRPILVETIHTKSWIVYTSRFHSLATCMKRLYCMVSNTVKSLRREGTFGTGNLRLVLKATATTTTTITKTHKGFKTYY